MQRFVMHLLLGIVINTKLVKYQKKKIEENQDTEGNFDFDSVKAISSEAVLASQWDNQKLPVIGGIAIPELEINLPIFKGIANVNLYTVQVP